MTKTVLTLLALLAFTAPAVGETTLTVHLPRSMSLKTGNVTLGQIGVILGETTLTEKAQAIPLGQLFTPDQQLTFTREQILSRLTNSGIPRHRIRLTGAQKVTIRRSASVIKAADIVALAQNHLAKQAGLHPGLVIEPLLIPKDLHLTQRGEQVQLAPRILNRSSVSQCRIRVSVLVDGLEQASCDVTFRLQYPHRIAVATRDLAAGQTLNEKDFKIQTQLKATPEPARWSPPVGLLTRRAVPSGTILTNKWVQRPVIPVDIKRNQSVVIRIQQPGLLITAMGQALADAHTGELLRVKNVHSRRIVLCRVQEDGSVAPAL